MNTSSPSTSIKNSENNITNNSESFSLRKLYDCLKQVKFPNSWSYSKLMFSEHDAILVSHWYVNRPAQKEFVINANGSVDVCIIIS